MKMEIQQLSGELKNTPTSASLACSSVSFGLNREETLSAPSKVLTDNNLEENFPSKRGLDLRVPVINLRWPAREANPSHPTKTKKCDSSPPSRMESSRTGGRINEND